MVTTRNRKRAEENDENKSERIESHRNGEQTVEITKEMMPGVSASNEEGELVENENGNEKREIATKAGEDRKRKRSRSTDSGSDTSRDDSRTRSKRKHSSYKDTKSSKKHSKSEKRRRSSMEKEKRNDNSEILDGTFSKTQLEIETNDLNLEQHITDTVKKEPTARDLEIARLLKEEQEHPDLLDADNDAVWSLKKAQIEKPSRQCPYLDTIDRCALDFDFEKLCSVSLSHINVYACMGRGTSTHAYTHSLDTNHRVFLNLSTLKFYCLPDNYEIIDPSLDDIKYVLKPTYTTKYIMEIDKMGKMARAFDGTTYYPGVVGLNNIKANDYENVVLHALSHVPPLRDYFLREENYINIKRPPGDKITLLPKRFGELIRKLWNPKAFKAHVSPHEMLQASVLCSNKKFQITKQGDAAEFLNFLLNTLHIALNGTRKTSSSIIYKIFRGRLHEFTRKVIPVETTEEARKTLQETDEYKEKKLEIPFLYLTLDLPAAPLYRDELLQNIIPQVPLSVLYAVFQEYKTYSENFMKRFQLVRLPPYLIITYKRFHKNQWFVEKNPTIVNFPISNVDLYDCLAEEMRPLHKYTTYDLVSNIVHDGPPSSGSYRVQILHNGTQKWYELEDLHVKEILPQMITLAESYIQIWRLNTSKTREQRAGETEEDEGETMNKMEQ
ncbi:u4/U6.U5 tri-snRNP-associated protein 2 family protein [Onchocerca flexuosa]|uniref:ubiquitinyl hydrolase 1 n=1 Tax=Onchocerca flexuosa TaxID=387005 RepID=A0A238C4U1_9BILA|nr:u4/U6.U5 tri-snRNP-associated protein 2 family protein [Onchocerca flexuosa]